MANPLSSVWEEFKNAPPGGKALAITAVVAVAGIGLYVGHHNTSGTASASNALPVDLSTVPDTGVPFANLPAAPPVSTGSTGATGGTSSSKSTGGTGGRLPHVPNPPHATPKKPKEPEPGTDLGSHKDVGGKDVGKAPLHPHATGIHSISSHGGTILR